MEKVTLPLSPTDMVGFFKDKTKTYLIDYHASLENLNNPKFLLMYIANLGLSCNIDIITPELLKEYMQLKEFSDILNLKRTHANVLYLAKYGEMIYGDHEYLMSFDDCVEFASTHHKLLIHQMAFLNSIPLYILTRMGAKDGDDAGRLNHELVTTVSNEQYDEIGYSLVKLFTIKDFLLAYLHTNVALEDQIYFTRYFDEYMFSGSNIFSYVFNDKNAYAGLFELASDVDAGCEDAIATLNIIMAQMQTILAANAKV